MKNKIALDYYDGSEGCECEIYKNGEVSICIVSNGEVYSEIDVDLKALGFNTIEELVVDLLNFGYELNL